MASILASAVSGLLRPGGTFLYVTLSGEREGADQLDRELASRGVELVARAPAPERYRRNPLASGDDDMCFLHFTQLSSREFELCEYRKSG